MYSVLITLHAVTAAVALVAGLVARRFRWCFVTYYGALIAMLIFLVLAVGADWRGRDLGRHFIVGALIGLGVFLVFKAEQARRARVISSRRFVDHLGFTLVGLIDAFVVVTVIDLGVAGWLIATIGVGIALLGHAVIAKIGGRPSGRPVDESGRARRVLSSRSPLGE